MSINRARYGNWAACGLFALAGSLWLAAEASAALVLGSADVGSGWPATAPVWTSELLTSASNRGVRSNRIQSQTFQVTEPISLESIFVGYRYNSAGNQDLPTTFRVVEIDDIGAVYDRNTVTVVAGPISTNVVPASPVINGFYGLRLDWTGSPVILTPRTAPAGYALEIVGADQSTSPIALMHRNDGPFSNGRAIGMNLSGVSEEFGSSDDFLVAITGSVVPEPATIALSAVALLGCVCFGRRRR